MASSLNEFPDATALLACAHNPAQPGAGRSQPRSSAGQSSDGRSLAQPGNSCQALATQRERTWTIVAPGTAPAGAAGVAEPGSCIGAGEAGPAGVMGGETGGETGGGPSGGTGGAAHAASNPRIAAPAPPRSPMDRRTDNLPMWIILLEALGALVVLLLIVWWTMFSGRTRGERRGSPDD